MRPAKCRRACVTLVVVVAGAVSHALGAGDLNGTEATFVLQRGDVVDFHRKGGDSLSFRGFLLPASGAVASEIDPRATRFEVVVRSGDPSERVAFQREIPAGDPGWRFERGAWSWTTPSDASPAFSARYEPNSGDLQVNASRLDFADLLGYAPAVALNTVESLRVGAGWKAVRAGRHRYRAPSVRTISPAETSVHSTAPASGERAFAVRLSGLDVFDVFVIEDGNRSFERSDLRARVFGPDRAGRYVPTSGGEFIYQRDGSEYPLFSLHGPGRFVVVVSNTATTGAIGFTVLVQRSRATTLQLGGPESTSRFPLATLTPPRRSGYVEFQFVPEVDGPFTFHIRGDAAELEPYVMDVPTTGFVEETTSVDGPLCAVDGGFDLELTLVRGHRYAIGFLDDYSPTRQVSVRAEPSAPPVVRYVPVGSGPATIDFASCVLSWQFRFTITGSGRYRIESGAGNRSDIPLKLRSADGTSAMSIITPAVLDLAPGDYTATATGEFWTSFFNSMRATLKFSVAVESP